MLSLARDLLKKTHDKDLDAIKPLTVCFWSDFMSNPSVMYSLFQPTPRKLNYDPDNVKVMGTKDGMINQINIKGIEDIESFHEEILGVPLLLRVWAEFQQNEYVGAQPQNDAKWEGDLALLVDTNHPMIRPELEKALDRARKIIQSRGRFCLQIDFSSALDSWLKATYPRGCCTIGTVRSHKARLYITNYDKPNHCFDCNVIWGLFLAPCWMLSAPFYKLYRHCKCTDIVIKPSTIIVRRAILPNGKIVEITKSCDLLTP